MRSGARPRLTSARNIPLNKVISRPAGKTWENWVRRYAEKRLAGEKACIESEKLD